eukprot:4842566-Pyramimonas_sp.AAC.1
MFYLSLRDRHFPLPFKKRLSQRRALKAQGGGGRWTHAGHRAPLHFGLGTHPAPRNRSFSRQKL